MRVPSAAVLIPLVLLVAVAPQRQVHGEGGWPSWRGPAGSGSAPRGDYPRSLTGDAIVWKTELPGKGCSTPIVHN
ncbi:MAG: hypothetical protein KDB14_35045, partial [Planctomycetales bacterium]|nr:hypothetical protein [Planctomycetales bacterium]